MVGKCGAPGVRLAWRGIGAAYRCVTHRAGPEGAEVSVQLPTEL